MKKVIFITTLLLLLGLSSCTNSMVLTFYTDSNTVYYETLCEENALVTTPSTDPVKGGYSFEGWYMDEAYTSPLLEGQICSGDMSIYGKFSTIEYTITFVDYDGSTIDSEYVEFGSSLDTIDYPTNPTRDGYTFTGWDLVIPSTMPAEDVVITAQYSNNATSTPYTITYLDYDDTVLYTITINNGESTNPVQEPTASRTGYEFVGWDTTLPAIMPEANVTLQATYTINSYTLYFTDYDGADLGSFSFEYNADLSTFTSPTSTRVGYIFTGWDTVIPSTMPADDITFTAQYVVDNSQTFTLSFENVDGTIEYSETFDVGDDLSSVSAPSITVPLGYQLVGWNQPIPSVMPEANVIIKPLYYRTYSYTMELGEQLNDHEVWTVDGYLLYFTNNFDWGDEALRDPSTLTIVEIDNPTNKRVIDIDKANGYMYDLLVYDNKIIVSSPGMKSGALYFFKLDDASYSESLELDYSNVNTFGTEMMINPDHTRLIVSCYIYDFISEHDGSGFYIVDISGTVPVLTSEMFNDRYATPELRLTTYSTGGIYYGDFFVITRDIGDELLIEVHKFSDINYLREFHVTSTMINPSNDGSVDLIYYQHIVGGVYTNEIRANSDVGAYTIDLRGDEPVFRMSQPVDFASETIADPTLDQSYNTGMYTLTTLFDSSWDHFVVIKDSANLTVSTIMGEYLYHKTYQNMLVLATRTETTISIQIYDVGDPTTLTLLNEYTYSDNSQPMPLFADDGEDIIVVIVNYSGEETIIHLDLTNIIQEDQS